MHACEMYHETMLCTTAISINMCAYYMYDAYNIHVSTYLFICIYINLYCIHMTHVYLVHGFFCPELCLMLWVIHVVNVDQGVDV